MQASEDELAALRETFFEEAEERLSAIESLMLRFEVNPQESDLVHTIFREIHSLKGGGAACQLDALSGFAHVFENLLSQMRLGALQVRPATLAVMLESVDVLNALLRQARTHEASLSADDVAAAIMRIQAELCAAGLESEPAPAASAASTDEVVWFDDLPRQEEEARVTSIAAPAPSSPERQAPDIAPASAVVSVGTSSLPPEDDGALRSEEDETSSGVLLAPSTLEQLIDRSIELTLAVAALGHAISQPSPLSQDRLRSLLGEACTHADEIQSALAGARANRSAALCEVVLVTSAQRSYFVPLTQVGHYFSIPPGTLKKVPMLGEVLDNGGTILHPVRLSCLLGITHDVASVAVVVQPELGPHALLVDEVVAQTRVVVRPLDPCLEGAWGVAGAAIYGGQVVLVLDLERLLADVSAKPRRLAVA